ncbi:poly(3-hydroxyalkanoate) depolymerase [Pollutimonas nitritireducens]|uniref:Poly(3-hydroxyalkanoate) depolymerase n=1 Tax=Pollutimonas nitritireducens TaxID=2045209 RepID=A0A2N4UDM1_9BURK|nr:PHB depolymerase family esterase [Pollutimonas nitritireducens]PLC53116.1 poly(3-hydroxyalkanoate) depolymerase [Pollutimonas nitritireducens]
MNMKSYRYSSAQGEREYLLFVPKGYGSTPLPLIIMLHGCKQDAADFSLGTGMNVLAEREKCLVAYPIQPSTASHEKCWNWYQPQHQHRDFGEPSMVAGITREIITNFKVDATRVYVAGMSAGGAMAAVMIHTYPDLYAAAGIHSGLPYGSASSLLSALGTMKMGISVPFGLTAIATHAAQERPLIVFHGDLDGTVVPSNSWELLKGFDRGEATVSEEIADSDEGRRSTLSVMESSDGIDAEHWSVHGASHAWAGGNESGSFTDANGPDASAEMMRFFLAHALQPSIT